MGRKPLPSSQRKRQFNIMLAPDIRAQLEKIAAANCTTVADEIRMAVNSHLESQYHDRLTRNLGIGVVTLADRIEQQTGLSWYRHPAAYEALKSAILELLELTDKETSTEPFELDPKTLGTSIARSLWHEWGRNFQVIEKLGVGGRSLRDAVEKAREELGKAKRGKPKK